ncbi:hypothetical protein DERP_001188 [Dermatophagoides pteronyssinus]|uniref:Uncharacterized protein n=1 Tax=Dermatophagoides pteronyssinus TaxID=6956 RepID=A0ABQ8JDS0_DERPT|nr:hypothetical protein DERP_001188 [Dermatophagoides pteronyssinus]
MNIFDSFYEEKFNPTVCFTSLATPGRFSGSYVISDFISVTALRIFLTISSEVSVNSMRDLLSASDLDIFCSGARKLLILPAPLFDTSSVGIGKTFLLNVLLNLALKCFVKLIWAN